MTELEKGILIGTLMGQGHFGGDGKQPQVTLKMHVKHEGLFLWLQRVFPSGRLYGPYHHGDRSYYQWMVRGDVLRQELMPLLDAANLQEIDKSAWQRIELMKERYGIE
jgi:hypothetical protein